LHVYLANQPGDYRLGSAGKAIVGYEVELRDSEGVKVAPGETGIMWVRGHSSAVSYWNRPDATSDTMREDWIYTGDRFRLDEDGFYYFLGRADALIKVSGQWIYPLEIEHCLGDHPHVVDCAVLGLAQANGLMTTKAFVELHSGIKPGPDLTKDLQSFVKAKLLPYKYPRVIEYLAELPKTGTGKVDRHQLKQDHEASLK
jgi:acetyl-CoA synthetase